MLFFSLVRSRTNNHYYLYIYCPYGSISISSVMSDRNQSDRGQTRYFSIGTVVICNVVNRDVINCNAWAIATWSNWCHSIYKSNTTLNSIKKKFLAVRRSCGGKRGLVGFIQKTPITATWRFMFL